MGSLNADKDNRRKASGPHPALPMRGDAAAVCGGRIGGAVRDVAVARPRAGHGSDRGDLRLRGGDAAGGAVLLGNAGGPLPAAGPAIRGSECHRGSGAVRVRISDEAAWTDADLYRFSRALHAESAAHY